MNPEIIAALATLAVSFLASALLFVLERSLPDRTLRLLGIKKPRQETYSETGRRNPTPYEIII